MGSPTPNMLGSPGALAHDDFELVVRRLADDIAFGTDVSMFVGAGLQYAGSRPYQPGDPVRSINWKLTARRGRTLVKEYEAIRRVPAFIVADTSASMVAGSTPTTKFDLAVWVAAAMGLVFLRRMSPVAVLSPGASRRRGTAPSLLRSDLWLALEALRAGAGAGTIAGPLRHAAVSAASTSVFAVIGDFDDDAGVEALLHCAQRHDCIAVRVFDPAEAGALRAGFFRGHEPETGAAFVGHGRARWDRADDAEARLLRAGIDVLRLRTDELPVLPLRRFLASRTPLTRRRS